MRRLVRARGNLLQNRPKSGSSNFSKSVDVQILFMAVRRYRRSRGRLRRSAHRGRNRRRVYAGRRRVFRRGAKSYYAGSKRRSQLLMGRGGMTQHLKVYRYDSFGATTCAGWDTSGVGGHSERMASIVSCTPIGWPSLDVSDSSRKGYAIQARSIDVVFQWHINKPQKVGQNFTCEPYAIDFWIVRCPVTAYQSGLPTAALALPNLYADMTKPWQLGWRPDDNFNDTTGHPLFQVVQRKTVYVRTAVDVDLTGAPTGCRFLPKGTVSFHWRFPGSGEWVGWEPTGAQHYQLIGSNVYGFVIVPRCIDDNKKAGDASMSEVTGNLVVIGSYTVKFTDEDG